MIEPRGLELLILRAVERVSRSEWVALTLPQLYNRLVEIDAKANGLRESEIIDALQTLHGDGSLVIQKRVAAGKALTYEALTSLDQFINHEFFDIGPFEVRLTHQGRMKLGEISVNVASPFNVASSSDEFDDLLSTLYRRRVFENDLSPLLEDATKGSTPLSLVIIDPDKFKDVNDKYRHRTGDDVLVAISELVSRRTRGKGKAYRYGGDEIAVLLPNYTKEEAATLAERVRLDIHETPLTPHQIRMTASLGVGAFPEHAQDSSSLIDCADKALYKAKELGRNLVRIFGEPDLVEAPKQQRRQPEPLRQAKLSQQTVGLMVQAYCILCAPFGNEITHDDAPLLSEDSLYNGLYELGVSASVLEECKYEYHWQFQLLLPALHDGRYFWTNRLKNTHSALGKARGRYQTRCTGAPTLHPNACIGFA